LKTARNYNAKKFQPCFNSGLELRQLPASVIPYQVKITHIQKREDVLLSINQQSVTASEVVNQPIPLDELKGLYRGLVGGLYPGEQNEPTGELAQIAKLQSESIQPLGRKGKINLTNGSIGFLTIGQSTTRMCFEEFQKLIKNEKNPKVKLINAAQDGVILQNWANESGPWKKTITQINKAGLNPLQIQVVWIESALLYPGQYGSGLNHIKVNTDLMAKVVEKLKIEFPNLRLIYCSSRYYAGYTKLRTSPEPFAYESAFAIRNLITNQMDQLQTDVRVKVAKSPAPTVLWGPYYWVNGSTASKIDQMSWNSDDCEPDGVHPSKLGRIKIAKQLAKFFTSDINTKLWFRKRP
jgi:hypothetical protein